MKIQLGKWQIAQLSLSSLISEDRPDNSFSMSTSTFFPEENNRIFAVGFEVELKDKAFDLFIKVNFMFNIDEDIDEAFKTSDFPKINAPAIAFPYLRAYISNLTLQSGFEPVILPSINFVEFHK